MKRLQEDTMCKMAVLGRGSMKDRKKVNILTVDNNERASAAAARVQEET